MSIELGCGIAWYSERELWPRGHRLIRVCLAWQGKAWQGKAWQGEVSVTTEVKSGRVSSKASPPRQLHLIAIPGGPNATLNHSRAEATPAPLQHSRETFKIRRKRAA